MGNTFRELTTPEITLARELWRGGSKIMEIALELVCDDWQVWNAVCLPDIGYDPDKARTYHARSLKRPRDPRQARMF